MAQREKFSSRLGFILVSAGCAIGLGNVWKFPYICGKNGGAIFVFVYLFFLLILGLPILISEFAVGRGSMFGSAKSFDELEKTGTKWHLAKWLIIGGNYVLMMFYTMIGGWMLYYIYALSAGVVEDKNANEIETCFNDMLNNPLLMTILMLIVVFVSLGICTLGLNKGIEKITKKMMVVLLALILILAIHSLTLNNAMDGVRFYLVPNTKSINENGIGSLVFDAMTHAFFTLSLGIGCMQIFGSYIKKDSTLVKESISVVILDTLVALLAGIIIIPACFSYGVNPDAGPSLIFITLPNVFNHMKSGKIWGTAFFIFMAFAALSTIIAVFENIVSFYIDQFGWTRKKSVIFNAFLIPVLSMPAILGFNILSGVSLLGPGSTIMDIEDFIISYNILPLGSLIYILFCTRENGWGFDNYLMEVNEGKGIKLSKRLKFYFSYIVPAIIVIIYLKGYFDFFWPKNKDSFKDVVIFVVMMLIAIVLLASIFILSRYKKHKTNKTIAVKRF